MNKKVLLFVLFSIIVVVLVLIKLNPAVPLLTQEQKKQALENILGRGVQETKDIPQGEKVYKGEFFSLSYPAYARLYDNKNPKSFRLDSEEPRFKFVAMVQGADSSTVLEELSGVKLRKQNKLYQELSIVVDGREGLLFVKTSDGVDPDSIGVERSIFFLKDGKSYSFSITGVDVEELEKVYGEIMNSVKFL